MNNQLPSLVKAPLQRRRVRRRRRRPRRRKSGLLTATTIMTMSQMTSTTMSMVMRMMKMTIMGMRTLSLKMEEPQLAMRSLRLKKQSITLPLRQQAVAHFSANLALQRNKRQLISRLARAILSLLRLLKSQILSVKSILNSTQMVNVTSGFSSRQAAPEAVVSASSAIFARYQI